MNARLPAAVLARADLPMLRLVHIHRMEPAFDCVSLVDAYQRRCALFRHDGGFIAVCDDPLSVDLQRWVALRAGTHVEWYQVVPLDLTDWLNKQGEVSSALQRFQKQTRANVGSAQLHELPWAA